MQKRVPSRCDAGNGGVTTFNILLKKSWARKAGDNAELDAQQKKWAANGKDIAAFLSGANPNWPKHDLEEMLQKHLDLTTQEVAARLNKDWPADIKAYDDNHVHMLMFSDMLTDGIAKQFPAKFKTAMVGGESQ